MSSVEEPTKQSESPFALGASTSMFTGRGDVVGMVGMLYVAKKIGKWTKCIYGLEEIGLRAQNTITIMDLNNEHNWGRGHV